MFEQVSKLLYKIYIRVGPLVYNMPVNPPSLKHKLSPEQETFDTVNGGQRVRYKNPGLKEWSWASFFPIDTTAPYVSNYKGVLLYPPIAYVAFFLGAVKSKTILNFYANSIDAAGKIALGVNTKCIIKSFEYEDRGGEVGDIYYNITLQEYKPFEATTVEVDEEDGTYEEKDTKREVAKNEVVEKGTYNWTGVAYEGSDSTGSMMKGTQEKVKVTLVAALTASSPIHIQSIESPLRKGWTTKGSLSNV